MNISKPLMTESGINSYHDFSGLTQLKANTQENPKDENTIRRVAQQFEATFIQEMMRTMRQATTKSDLIESSGLETFEGLFDKEVSLQISKKGGFGVADLLVKQLRDIPDITSSKETKNPSGFEITNNRIFPLESFPKK